MHTNRLAIILGVALLSVGASAVHAQTPEKDKIRAERWLAGHGVWVNDVFAFLCGKTLGKRKLVPNTSPNKTVAGHLGALMLTTPLVATIAHFTFAGTALDTPLRLVVLGALTSITGQLGDLLLSSIKRDLGIKDMSDLIPGHGGVLDRANSLLLAAPAVFHYVHYVVGVGVGEPTRVLTGR